MLYDKWWKNSGDTCTRNEKGKESKANSLGVDNIGGVFVVLLCGLAFAVIIAIFEFCYNSKKNALAEKVRKLLVIANCNMYLHFFDVYDLAAVSVVNLIKSQFIVLGLQ